MVEVEGVAFHIVAGGEIIERHDDTVYRTESSAGGHPLQPMLQKLVPTMPELPTHEFYGGFGAIHPCRSVFDNAIFLPPVRKTRIEASRFPSSFHAVMVCC